MRKLRAVLARKKTLKGRFKFPFSDSIHPLLQMSRYSFEPENSSKSICSYIPLIASYTHNNRLQG